MHLNHGKEAAKVVKPETMNGVDQNLGSPLEEAIGARLRQKGLKLAAAESCTGGLVGHRITNVPGSSDYFLGSVTAYAYEAKERLLGVSHETLAKFGAVSRETALEMARGVRHVLEADIGLSVTGIAGPGGGLPNKPVGLVWIGLSAPDGEWVFCYLWHGSRVENKAFSAQAVLQLLMDYLNDAVPAESSAPCDVDEHPSNSRTPEETPGRTG
jgi:PncC family amidohydrolase